MINLYTSNEAFEDAVENNKYVKILLELVKQEANKGKIRAEYKYTTEEINSGLKEAFFILKRLGFRTVILPSYESMSIYWD